MSSHHIVRDNQEPALLLLETDHTFDIVQQLLEWSPTVIVHESQLDKVLTWRIKMDVVLLEESHEEEVMEKAAVQFPLKLIRYRAGESDVSATLHFLKAGNYPSLNIVTQQNLFDTLIAFESKMDLVIFAEGIRWSLIRSGRYEKKLADHSSAFIQEGTQTISIHPDRENKIKVERPSSFWIGEKL